MKKVNRKSKHWPMNWILGGVFLLAFTVLIAYGLQGEDPEPVVHRVADRVLPAPVVREAPPAEPLEPVATPEPAAPELAEFAEPDPVPVSFEEAEGSYHAAEYIQAASRFASYRDEHPGNPWGHYMLGLSEWKLGDLEAAEAALLSGLALDSTFVKARRNLARVLMADDRHQEALDLLSAAAVAEIAVSEHLRLTGRALHNLARPDEAVDAYAAALAADSGDAWSLNNLGLIFVEQGEFDDALAAFALAVERDGDVAAFRNNLGVALERCGHGGQAAEAYRSALELDDGHERARLSLARVEAVVETPSAGVDLATLAASIAADLAAGRFPWSEAPVEDVAEIEVLEELLPETEPLEDAQITQWP